MNNHSQTTAAAAATHCNSTLPVGLLMTIRILLYCPAARYSSIVTAEIIVEF